MRVEKAKVSWCYYEDSFDHGSPWNAFRDPERHGPLFENYSSTGSGKRLYLLWGRSHLQGLYGCVSFLNRPRRHASYILGCEHVCSHSLFSPFPPPSLLLILLFLIFFFLMKNSKLMQKQREKRSKPA